MLRPSIATLILLGIILSTLSMAAVSEYRPSQNEEKSVISEDVFEEVASSKQDSPMNDDSLIAVTQADAKPKVVVPVLPPIRKTLSTIQPEDYQDWLQSDKSQLRSHQVRLTQDGRLAGRVILFDPTSGAVQVVKNTQVTFLKAGSVFAVSEPGPGGVFQATGISPGVYGVAVTGESGLALFSVHVFPSLERGEEIKDTKVLKLEIAAIPSSDMPVANSIISPFIQQTHAVIPTEPAEEEIPESAKVTDKVIDSFKGTTTREHTIRLQADGSLVGRVRRLHPISGRAFLLHSETDTVFFVQNNGIVYKVSIGSDGRFVIPNFRAGVYTVVSGGQDGVGVIGVRVLPVEKAAGLNNAVPTQYVSFLQGGAPAVPNFDISLLGPENFQALFNLLSPEEFSNLVGGGTLGGGGGGGAGYGGGFPWGALGLLGLLGLDDDPKEKKASP